MFCSPFSWFSAGIPFLRFFAFELFSRCASIEPERVTAPLAAASRAEVRFRAPALGLAGPGASGGLRQWPRRGAHAAAAGRVGGGAGFGGGKQKPQ